MLLGWLFSGLALAAAQAPPAADRPPAAVNDLRAAAIAVYTPALAGDWATAAERMPDIDRAMRDLPPKVGKADLVDQLHDRVKGLKDSVGDRRAIAAATNANWIARLADEIAAEYETSVSPDARLLAFFGREIAIDAQRPRHRGAQRDVADLKTVWQRVEPMVLPRSTEAARQFDDALVRMDGTVRRGDLAAAARSEVAASDQILAALRTAPAAR